MNKDQKKLVHTWIKKCYKSCLSTKLMDMILEQLSKAPDSQVDSITKEEIIKFDASSDAEKYDFIVNISNKSNIHISSFVKELCCLDKYYIRPK